MIGLLVALALSMLRMPANLLAAAPLQLWAVAIIGAAVLWAIITIQADLASRQPRTGRITYA